ncbi:MAG: DUF2520 domain-containing protein [Porticoccaceae bacterium]|nr:DUF2520 domain-containing protein [Porticoccaceae bacterium]
MTAPRLNIIGCGRVAKTLGRLFGDRQLAAITTIYSRNLDRGRAACGFLGQGSATDNLASLAPANVWLIAVADDAIAPMVRQLAELDHLHWDNSIVFHCSGIHSSSLLQPLAEKGAATASLHPIHSFANPADSIAQFQGTYCTAEGDPDAVDSLTAMFAALGAITVAINSDRKALYHAATAVASNHLVALIANSLEMLNRSGVEPSIAALMLKPLILGSAGNALTTSPQTALTGPIQRGDSDSVRKHLGAIENYCPELLIPYRVMARETLKLATANPKGANSGHQSIAALLAVSGD